MQLPRFAVVALCAVVSASVNATSKSDGGALLATCGSAVRAMDKLPGSTEPYDSGYCFGFIHGMLDVSRSAEAQGLQSCPPAGVTVGQVTRVVVDYVHTHPEQRHMPDTQLAIVALKSTYPCPS